MTFSLFFTTVIAEAFEATHWLPITRWQVEHINHHGGRGEDAAHAGEKTWGSYGTVKAE